MLTASVLALLLAMGVPAIAVAIVGAAVLHPIWFLAGVATWTVGVRVRSRPRPVADREADLLRGIAAELEAGSSLRGAIVAAARRAPELDLETPARLATAGRPYAEIADRVGSALQINGMRAGAAIRLSGETGARAADTFSKLATLAAAAAAVSREERALTAQSRFSAGLIAGTPVLLIGAAAVAGRGLPDSWMLAVGGALLAAGVLAILTMSRQELR